MSETLVEAELAKRSTGWSIGVLGALAEFDRDEGEPALEGATSVVTARGAIGLDPHSRMRAIAYEALSAHPDAWLHGVALCLPRSACRMHARETISEVGPDADALRPDDREAILFDLGLGAECFDFCVRVAERAHIAFLRGVTGRTLLDDPALFADIVQMSPQRVFVSALGRIEIYQPIGAAGGATPQGPHTHLLPRLLRCGHSHSANLPIPRDWTVCATLYPAHPIRDREGEGKPFDPGQHDAFQALLRAFGEPDSVAVKDAVWRAVRNAVHPAAFPALDGRHARLARRVALRQMAYTDGASPQLAAWQSRFDPPGARRGAALA
jgi:hypothetical protein